MDLQANRDFADILFNQLSSLAYLGIDTLLDEALEWICARYEPYEIYPDMDSETADPEEYLKQEALEAWVENNGYVKEED